MEAVKSKNGVTNIFLQVMSCTLLGFVLFYPPFSWDWDPPASFWIKQIINLLIMLAVFHVNYRYMAPRLLLKGKVPAFVIYFVFSLAAMLVLARFIEIKLGVFEDVMKLKPNMKAKNVYAVDMYLFMTYLMAMAVSTCLAVIQRWQTDSNLREQIEKRQIASELAVLKAQINPHFFFNTLNNIYALTYSDIPLSRDAILKLSRMMRYVLYETLQDRALLSKEISFIKDYIELMKLRLHACTTVVFKEPVPDKDYIVAPMLLLPFIENAFKHGTSALEKTEIVIDLQAKNGVLSLHVENQIYRDKGPLNMESGGIGLVNTQRRLDLLYPQRHSLRIHEGTERSLYSIELTIDMNTQDSELPLANQPEPSRELAEAK
jgi:hypothetical protein